MEKIKLNNLKIGGSYGKTFVSIEEPTKKTRNIIKLKKDVKGSATQTTEKVEEPQKPEVKAEVQSDDYTWVDLD